MNRFFVLYGERSVTGQACNCKSCIYSPNGRLFVCEEFDALITYQSLRCLLGPEHGNDRQVGVLRPVFVYWISGSCNRALWGLSRRANEPRLYTLNKTLSYGCLLQSKVMRTINKNLQKMGRLNINKFVQTLDKTCWVERLSAVNRVEILGRC